MLVLPVVIIMIELLKQNPKTTQEKLASAKKNMLWRHNGYLMFDTITIGGNNICNKTKLN